MSESTAAPSPDTMVAPSTVDTPPSDLLGDLAVLLQSLRSVKTRQTTTGLRLDGKGWPYTVSAAADKAAAARAAADFVAHLNGRKQPHFYVAIHITAVRE